MEKEYPLAGGNASGRVVRIGSTVRKPWLNSTPSVFEFMVAIRSAGVDVPAAIGRDAQGRQVTEFIPGRLALDAGALTHSELDRVGRMVRAIHDASEHFTPASGASWSTAIPAPGRDLICHNDLAPWNLVTGERWTFIDWDAAAPSTRLWDLAYAAQAFTLNDAGRPAEPAGRDLAAFVDGYGATGALRTELPAAMHRRTSAMLELLRSSHDTGIEPWASMYVGGHGAHWEAVARYVEHHQNVWADAIAPAS